MRDEPLKAFSIDRVVSLEIAASPKEYSYIKLEKGSIEFYVVSIAMFIRVNIL
jgi:hypothetical protein